MPHLTAVILTTAFVLHSRSYVSSLCVNITHLEIGVFNSAVTVKVFRAKSKALQ